MNYTGKIKKREFWTIFIKNKMNKTRFYDIKTCFHALDKEEFREKFKNLQDTLA